MENLIEGTILLAAWTLLLSVMLGIGGGLVWLFEQITQALRANSQAPRTNSQAPRAIRQQARRR